MPLPTGPKVLTAAMLVAMMSSTAAAQLQFASKWKPWIEIGGAYSSGSGNNGDTSGGSHGEVTLFMPLVGDQEQLFFTQLTGRFFQDEVVEGNFAAGLRRMMPSGVNLGGWIGGDIRQTESDNTFRQLSGGVELSTDRFDARVNWYGPVTDPQLADADFSELILTDTSLFLIGGREVALKGIDGEIGFRVPVDRFMENLHQFDLRIYGGGFHFDHDDAHEEVTGVKGRVELRFHDLFENLPGSKLTADYEVHHDDLRDTRHQFGLRLRIPLGSRNEASRLADLSEQEWRMLDGIQRDVDIITTQSGGETVEDALTGTDFDRVAYAGGGTGITDASTAAGDDSLIIANGIFTGQQQLQGDQTLLGGGRSIVVRGTESNIVKTLWAPGDAAELVEPADDDSLLLLGSNIHVSGLSIVGSGTEHLSYGDSIELGDDHTNVFITNVDISDMAGGGIYAGNGNTLTMLDVNIDRTWLSGIEFGNFNTVSIDGGSITNAGEDGVKGDSDNTINITGLTVDYTYEDGLDFYSYNDVTIDQSTILNSGESGIEFEDYNAVSITNTTVTGFVDAGLYLNDYNTLTVNGLTISGFGAEYGEEGDSDVDNDGIYFDDDNIVSLINVEISHVAERAIHFDDRNGTAENPVWIENVEIFQVGKDGIDFSDDNFVTIKGGTITDVGKEGVDGGDENTLHIDGLTVERADGDGIFVDDGNTVLIENTVIRNVGEDGLDTGDSIESEGDEDFVQSIVTVRNTIIDGADDDGMDFGGQDGIIRVEGGMITNVEEDGIITDGANNEITIDGISISNVGLSGDGNGIFIEQAREDGDTEAVTINAVVFSGTMADYAISFDDVVINDLTISNNVFNNATGQIALRFGEDAVATINSGLSIGNVNNTGTAITCEADEENFTGAVTFTDGQVLVATGCIN
ncbi:MAG: right-handed parallel beta-helix repeat-containing protein [Rhizobiaceae bacterium]